MKDFRGTEIRRGDLVAYVRKGEIIRLRVEQLERRISSLRALGAQMSWDGFRARRPGGKNPAWYQNPERCAVIPYHLESLRRQPRVGDTVAYLLYNQFEERVVTAVSASGFRALGSSHRHLFHRTVILEEKS